MDGVVHPWTGQNRGRDCRGTLGNARPKRYCTLCVCINKFVRDNLVSWDQRCDLPVEPVDANRSEARAPIRVRQNQTKHKGKTAVAPALSLGMALAKGHEQMALTGAQRRG